MSLVREAAKVYQGCRHCYHVSCLNIHHKENAAKGCPLCVSTDVYKNLFFTDDSNNNERRSAGVGKGAKKPGRSESLDTIDSEPEFSGRNNNLRERQMEAFDFALQGGKLTYDDFADDI